MAIRLELDTRYVSIKGADRATLKKIEKACSYRLKGFMFSAAYKAKRWDGYEHLLKFSDKHGYRAPIGMYADIVETLQESGSKIIVDDGRTYNGPVIEYNWNPDITPRGYQGEAEVAMLAADGCGMLKMPIRSGKTKTAARIIKGLGRRTLFIVPSTLLLEQSRASLADSLQCEVGAIGDGEWDIQDVTVVTAQSLARHRGGRRDCDGTNKCGKCSKPHKFKYKGKMQPCPGDNSCKRCLEKHTYLIKPTAIYKKLIKRFDVIIMDECHHLTGDAWRKSFMDFRARHRIGLSATIYLERDDQNELGAIWLKACTGNIQYEVSVSRLVEEGYLLPMAVEMYAIREPDDLKDMRWSQRLKNAAMDENEFRNAMIAAIAHQKVSQSLQTMIISNRLNQIDEIARLCDKANLTFVVITGNTKKRERASLMKGWLDGDCDLLIGTVLREGVDIPSVEVVINAEGGRDIKSTIQRMRNMTISEGKDTAIMVDFADLTNSYFATHSRERMEVYQSEDAFNLRYVKADGLEKFARELCEF